MPKNVIVKVPQRKPNKWMSGEELLNKSITGKHILRTEKEKKEEEIKQILNHDSRKTN